MFSKKDIKNIYELTPLQEGILFHSLHEADSAAYLEQSSLHVASALNVALFQQTWQSIIQRHDVLRTIFVHKNVPTPLQIVLKQRELDFHFADLRGLSPAEQDAHCLQYKQTDRQRTFDLSKDRLIRVAVLQRGERAFEVILTFHHILMDGWSSLALQEEFALIYTALLRGETPQLPSPVPFNSYIKWLKAQDKQAARQYWQDSLAGYTALASLPRPAQPTQAYTAQQHRFSLDAATTRALAQQVAQAQVTLNTLVQAAWGLLLGQYSGKQEVVFGTTVSGRPAEIPGIERMVGLFINAIPVRVRLAAARTFSELLQQLQQAAAVNKNHHYYSLADIQADSALKQPLFDHILVFENYPEVTEAASDGLVIERFEHVDHTHYDLTIQAAPGEQLGFLLIYNQAVYSTALIVALENQLRTLFAQVAKTTDWALDTLELLSADEKARYLPAPALPPLRVVVAASFTAEPLAPYVRGWGPAFGVEIQVEFAPYNQVFQQLLASDSLLSSTTGLRCVLLRFEDWLRATEFVSDQASIAHLDRYYADLLAIFAEKRQTGQWLVGIFPVATHLGLSAPVIAHLQDLNQQWRAFLADHAATRIIDGTWAAQHYQVDAVFDSHQDQIGHLPFSEAYYAVLGAEIARPLLTAHHNPFKVIAVDCDNTLWGGVCGEDGSTGVEISGGYLALQEHLLRCHQAGFILVLCSKNNEQDVWAVFAQHPQMRLKREHIVTQRINWQAKSRNLQEMATELNLGLDSFIFIDDSRLECAEVMNQCPQVLTLALPSNAAQFADYLQQVWAFDKPRVTAEDRVRSALYQAEQQRRTAQTQALSLADFLSHLDIHLYLTQLDETQIPRVAQLTQRTNQFNLSTIRRQEDEIRRLQQQANTVCWTVEVTDKFGEYGLVGVIIGVSQADTLRLDTFLLSCRVLGRQVEVALLCGLRGWCESQQLTRLEAEYRPTEKNPPFLAFLKQTGWHEAGQTGSGTRYQLAVAELPSLAAPLTLHLHAKPVTAPPPISVSVANAAAPVSSAVSSNHSTDTAWTLADTLPDNLRHAAWYLPLRYHHAAALSALALDEETAPPARVQAAYAPPENAQQQTMLTLWQAVLGQARIGIHDDFFELGGHSLKATRLVSRIHQAFHVELPLQAIFQQPTIAGLCGLLETATPVTAEVRIPVLPPQADYALSPAQRRLWVLQQMDAQSSVYNTPVFLRLAGAVNVAALERSFSSLIQRHEVLRSTFISRHGEPRQVIQPAGDFSLTVKDLRTEAEPLAVAQQLARTEATTPFDLRTGPLLRVSLLQLAETQFVLLFNTHHITSDGWSAGVLERELLTLYQAHSHGQDNPLPPLRIQYKDYAAWQNARLQADQAQAHRAYWLQQLGGDLPLLDFPADYPRPPVQTFRGQALVENWPPALLAGLKALGQSQQASLFMTLLAWLNTLLYHHSGQSDVIIGTPVAGRTHPDLENQVGFYLNTLALRSRFQGQDRFVTLLQQVRETTLAADAHQIYPFDQLVDELHLARDMSRSPLFDVMLVVQDWQNSAASLPVTTLNASAFETETTSSRFDLVFDVSESAEGLRLQLTYNPDLYQPQRMQRLLQQGTTLAYQLLRTPEQTLAQLTILPPAERQQVLYDFNAHAHAWPDTATLVTLFAAQVAAHPERLALSSPTGQLSYRALDQRANQVAQYLRQHFAPQPDQLIGVLAERGADLLIALLGILKAGAAYLPIDPDYPPARIAAITQHSGCKTVLNAALLAQISQSVPLDSPPPPTTPASSDLAYVIYTSGSTGQPKGVMIEHRAFINMILAQIRAFGVTGQDRVLQFASPAFDASLSEIFMALLSGATLVPVSKALIQDSAAFCAYLRAQQVTVATLPPAYLNSLGQDALPTLQVLITAGEAAVVDDALAYARQLRYFNAYGPTETAVCASWHRVVAEAAYPTGIPIGQPLSNLAILILNPALHPVPIGVAGEIHVAGPGLARGYLHDPLQSAEKFIPHPFLPGARLYKTGDIGRWRADGQIEFLGRRDEQLKVRGHRIEPGEITHQLLRHPDIREAVVLRHDHSLLACVVTTAADTDFKAYLRQFLPEYLIPTRFVALEALPVNSSGKIDKRALETLLTQRAPPPSAPQPPSTAQEQQIAAIWQSVLGLSVAPGVTDNFFDVGGDSIKAIQILARLREAGLSARAQDLFLHPSIAQLATKIAENQLCSLSEVAGPQHALTGPVPLTAIQAWFFQAYPQARAHFNLSELFYARQGLDAAAVRTACAALQQHHDALRLCYHPDPAGGLPQQINQGDELALAFSVSDLRPLAEPLAARDAQIQALQSSFDLSRGPLLKVALFHAPDGDYLLFVIHHLVIDGVSWRIFLADFLRLYQQAQSEAALSLPAKTCSFQSWAEKIHAYSRSAACLQQLDSWQALARRAPPPFLPDQTVADNTRQHLAVARFSLSAAHTQTLLTGIRRRYGATINEILLTALAGALKGWHGQPETLIMLEGHGRDALPDDTDVSRTIGWFTSTYPVILNAPDTGDTAQQIAATRAALAHSNAPTSYGILKYLTSPAQTAGLAFTVQPQISFNYLGQYDADLDTPLFAPVIDIPDWSVSDTAVLLYDFDFNGLVALGQLHITLAYHRQRYHSATIEKIMDGFQQKLQALLGE